MLNPKALFFRFCFLSVFACEQAGVRTDTQMEDERPHSIDEADAAADAVDSQLSVNDVGVAQVA